MNSFTYTSTEHFFRVTGSVSSRVKRLESVDLLRSITMVLMIFVNDVAGVSNTPYWLGHSEANEDAMGFADIIFPAFLFIVGLSLPLAIEARIAKGKSWLSNSLYIMGRSMALIIMGFFHVNSENYSQAAMLPSAVWMLLVTLSFFLIWLKYPEKLNKNVALLLKSMGIILLILMAWLYKGENAEGMSTSWWGILGIIGWAYLVCAWLFLLLKNSNAAIMAMSICFGVLNILSHTNLISFNIPLIGDGSSVFLVMAGAVSSQTYSRIQKGGKFRALFMFLITSFLLLGIGVYIRPFTGGISKIYSTPAWTFICAGITLLAFCVSIFIADIEHKASLFNWIKPAGTSTLTCYLVPYILYSLFDLAHFWYPSALNSGIPGILRSITVAFLIVAVVGLGEKKGFRLKL